MRFRIPIVCVVCVLASVCGGGAEPNTMDPVVRKTASVTVSLAASSVAVGETTQASATTADASGGTLTGRAISWSSTSSVASVDANGLVVAATVGTATITATSDGKSASAQLTVVPARPAGLSISVDGTIRGTPSAVVTIDGPNGFADTANVALGTAYDRSDLAPGAYTVVAWPRAAIQSTGVDWYSPPLAQRTKVVTIAAGTVATTAFTYRLSSGVVSVQATGVPVFGMSCAVVFDSIQPSGIAAGLVRVSSGQSNARSVPGTGPARLECDAAIDRGLSIEPTPVQQVVTIPASTTPVPISVSFSLPAAPGGLTLTVSGVPSGASSVSLEIHGPRRASAIMSAGNGTPVILDRLSPGTYVIGGTTSSIQVANKLVQYSTPVRTVTVVSGQSLGIQLDYAPAP